MAEAKTKKVILSIADISALTVAERYVLYKANVVSPFKAIGNAQKKFTDGMQMAAKLHASLKREHVAMLAVGTLAAGTSEKEFFEKHCGGAPSGRVLAVSTFFNAMCMTLVEQVVTDADGKPVEKDGKPVTVKRSLIDEQKHFDPHSGNALEIAAACIGHERKALPDGWMGSVNTQDVIAALSNAGDATSKLKEIRARQKGTKEAAGEDTNPPHSIASCIAFLMNAIAVAADILKGENGEEIVSGLFHETYFNMGNAWRENGVDDTLMLRWTANIEQGRAPMLDAAPAPEPPKAEPKKSAKVKAEAPTEELVEA